MLQKRKNKHPLDVTFILQIIYLNNLQYIIYSFPFSFLKIHFTVSTAFMHQMMIANEGTRLPADRSIGITASICCTK